jgi:hypothetical protein
MLLLKVSDLAIPSRNSIMATSHVSVIATASIGVLKMGVSLTPTWHELFSIRHKLLSDQFILRGPLDARSNTNDVRKNPIDFNHETQDTYPCGCCATGRKSMVMSLTINTAAGMSQFPVDIDHKKMSIRLR